MIALAAVSPLLAQPAETAETLTLRLRAVPLRDVLYVLFEMTGQGYVIDADVVGRADVELVDNTPAEIEAALEGLGVALSAPGRLRRVAALGPVPTLRLPGTGHPVEFAIRRPADVRDFLRLLRDISGDEVVAPPGPLGRFVAFAHEVPVEDLLSAVLATARLDSRRDGLRVSVWRPADPDAVLLPSNAGSGNYGHVAHREGGPATRPSGVQGVTGKEVSFTGLVGRGAAWAAMTTIGLIRAGQQFYDGKLESVSSEGAVIVLEDGQRLEWRIAPADPGLTPLPQDAGQAIERATVAMHALLFDDAERILRSALEAARGEEAGAVRGALADLHFAWAQSLLARRAVPEAVRQLEAAYEIDRAERPWQAGEDLNEIGFAWAGLAEPERAIGPHRQALEIARTGDFGSEPPGPGCVRIHPRSASIEPAALVGLANAERARGRLAEARESYQRAFELWRGLGDPYGQSAALTGLGLVQQALGQLALALRTQQQALATLSRFSPAPPLRAALLNNLGSAQLAAGRRDQARASFDAVLADYRLVRDRAGEGTVLNNLGALRESRGETAAACSAYDEALQASRDGDDRSGRALTLARVERLVGRARSGDKALARCREALEEARP